MNSWLSVEQYSPTIAFLKVPDGVRSNRHFVIYWDVIDEGGCQSRVITGVAITGGCKSYDEVTGRCREGRKDVVIGCKDDNNVPRKVVFCRGSLMELNYSQVMRNPQGYTDRFDYKTIKLCALCRMRPKRKEPPSGGYVDDGVRYLVKERDSGLVEARVAGGQ